MTSNRPRLAVLVACLAGLAASFAAAPLAAQKTDPAPVAPKLTAPKLTAPLPVDPAVTIGTLPNGLRYYIRVNHRPEKRAELRLVVNAGSVLEDSSQRGLAHMVEHMAFSGTKHFPEAGAGRLSRIHGVRFGADLNASTSFDETVYELTVPTDSARLFDKGVRDPRRLVARPHLRLHRARARARRRDRRVATRPRRRGANARQAVPGDLQRLALRASAFRSATSTRSRPRRAHR